MRKVSANVVYRRGLFALFLLALIPISLSFTRKLATFGRADILLSEEGNGYRVRYVGPSAEPSQLVAGDLLIEVNGASARGAGDPTRLVAAEDTRLLVRRGREVLRLSAPACPTPFDSRYLFLFLVGGAFFVSGLGALRAAHTGPENLLFAGLALCATLVLALTPAPPIDGFYRAAVLTEDVARALFPAFLLILVFTFPRRARGFTPWPVFIPAGLLLALTAQTYLLPRSAGDIEAAIVRLDGLQAAWLSGAAILAAVRLAVLSRRKIDLLTEKQVRFLLFGTAVGLLPLCVLDLLPRLLGGTLPVLSALSLLPLALVPLAFLAALTRYRLWDAEVLGRETTALVGAVFVGAGFFTLAHLVLAQPLLTGVPYAKEILQTSAGLLLALSFVPVRRGLSAAIARLQYRDAWKDRESLLSLVRELPTPRRLAELQTLLVSRVSSALRVSPAALLFVHGEMLDASMVDGGPPIPIAELPAGAVESTTRLTLGGFGAPSTEGIVRLRRSRYRTLSPLAVSGKLLALLALGDREGREPLSRDDEDLLETVLAPASLALSNARLYEELRTQADRYRALKEFHEDVVSGSAAAIAATDETGLVTSHNSAFARLVGREGEDLRGQQAEVLLAVSLPLGSQQRVELPIAGHRAVVDVAVSQFPGAEHGSRARVYVLQDATETARLERALADRERLSALGTLSAGVAHEVNTPLTGVAGFARLLLDDTPADDPRRPILEKIERQAFRASRLVGSLLDIARGRPRDLVPLDPKELAREAARSIDDEVRARGVSFRLELQDDAPRIVGHADALVQVLLNLVKNALEAVADRPDGGHVVLRLRVSGENVVFEVEDDGKGLTEDEATRVFEPFYSTKTAQGGTGLGLAIASDIIRSHRGVLKVESVPGHGSRFVVSVPAAAPAASPVLAATTASS